MRFFSKNKNNDLNSGFVINTDDFTQISGDKKTAPHAMTADEVASLWVIGDDTPTPASTGALDSLKKRMHAHDSIQADTTPEPDLPKTVDDKKISKKTLVEKIKRYTVDEHGHDAAQTNEPLYKLESVAEILKSDSEEAIKKLSKKYDISIDDLGHKKSKSINTDKSSVENDDLLPIDAPDASITPTPTFEQMVINSAQRESQKIFDSLFPSESKPVTPVLMVPDISDIDTNEFGISSQNQSNTATIRFTPVTNSRGNTDHITISSVTQHIDLDSDIPEDIVSHSTTQLEQSDFENFIPSIEYQDTNSGKKISLKLARIKRNCFLSSFISALMLIALSVFLIPFVYDYIISNPKVTMFICSAFLFVSVVANLNMFLDFKRIFKRYSGFDTMASLCSCFTLALGVTAALTDANAYYIILLCSIILLTRSICKFKYVYAQSTALKQLIGDKQKNILTLVDDPATTFAMAKNSIEGSVLVAACKKSKFVEDFMKHFEFHKTMFGKISIIFLTTLILSLISGISAYFYYNSIFSALFAAACISCLATLPSAFFIDSLPFSTATKKLHQSSAMIAGIYGAHKIENANAAAIKVTDIFPSGTITMHNMKVLSNNNIDHILLRAVSLTAAVGSPLEPIFKEIAGSNNSYSIPDADTIKYEKNLGISGWVDNEPLFIGNRSLMRAHGIEIPSLEVDKRILQKGYFPVYVATSSVACALIVIQYNVNLTVAKELHKITNLGVTLLFENCDPNVTEEMICDYFGLYEGSVKIMSNAGVHMYKNAEPDVASCSAPAAYFGSGLNFIKIINRASGIKTANLLLTVMYAIFSIVGIVYFVYAAFSGITTMPQQTTVLLYALSTLLLSIIGFLIRKP